MVAERHACGPHAVHSMLAIILGIAALAASPSGDVAPWPTLHKDAQRSGYTEKPIAGPYERKWFRDFHDEMIATRVEAIVAEGKCFVGTFAGRMYALDVTDGKTLWQFQAAGPIGASACYHDGRVYFGSDDGFVYCRTADGKEVWRYRAAAGVWVAPTCDTTAVYFGDRAGVFHAVSVQTGKAIWTFKADNMILTPASLTADGGKVVFGSEDMHVYCLSPQGKLLWKSAKLGGLSMRDHAPTLWQGLAIVTTNPARDFHSTPGQSPAILTAVQKSLPMEAGDKVIFDQWGSYTMKLTPRRLKAEQEAVRQYLAKNRPEQTFYAFDLADGSEPWIAPILYTGGLHNPATPPTFNPKTGDLYAWVPTALSNYSAGVPGGAIAVGKLDRQTGLPEILWHTNGDKLHWAFDFVAPADETQSLSLMDGVLLNTHQGIIGGMNLQTLKWHHVYIARDTYGGIFGPAVVQGSFQGADKAHAQGVLTLMPNEWHGPDRGVAAIGYDRLFWVAGSQVVCLGGPNVAKTSTGGTQAPPPIQRKTIPVVPAGNVAVGFVGRLDANVHKPDYSAEQFRKYLTTPPAIRSRSTLTDDVRRRLDAAVAELISAQWTPLIIELGISHEDRYFWRTAETMQIVAMALPYLSPEIQTFAKKYLDDLFAAGSPLRSPVHPDAAGQRREAYDLGSVMQNYARKAPSYRANIEDLYGVWAYAHYADRWDRILPELPAIRAIFDTFAASPATFDHEDKARQDASEHLNAQIAGTLAYARIMVKAGPESEVNRALQRLADLVAFRIHHEQADTRFIRSTRNEAHTAKLPRYLNLTPEIGQMLCDLAGESVQRNVRALSDQLPVWHHAFGERMIGGENYISPPTLARGLFSALADSRVASPDELASRLDQPWCKADLYYIEKLTALLRRADTVDVRR